MDSEFDGVDCVPERVWWELRSTALWGGALGSYLRHGEVLDEGLLCFGRDIPRSWMPYGQLFVTCEACERLICGGWPSEEWAPHTLRWRVDVPWQLWAEGVGTPEVPRDGDFQDFIRNKKWRWTEVNAAVMQLRPLRVIDVQVVAKGDSPLDGVALWTASQIDASFCAQRFYSYGSNGVRSSADRCGVVLSPRGRELWRSAGLDDGSYRWERVDIEGSS